MKQFKNLLLIVVLIGCFAFVQGSPDMAVEESGEVSPDISIPMDTGNADCTLVGWDDESDDAKVSCADQSHRDPSDSGYDLYSEAAERGAGWAQFASSKTELWFQFYLYVDVAPWAETSRFVCLDSAVNAAPCDLFIHVRDSTGYKWGWGADGSNYYDQAASSPQQDMWVRVHLVKHNTAGVVEVWESTTSQSAGYSKVVDHSSQDTTADTNWDWIGFGFNGGDNHAAAWYFDNVKIWYSNPGW